jgi:hypothetical protein
MGGCCCKVHTLDPQFVRDLEAAVRDYGRGGGIAAVVDKTGEVLVLDRDPACLNGELLLSLVPWALRSAISVSAAVKTGTDFRSVTLKGNFWECQIHALPQSRTTFVWIADSSRTGVTLAGSASHHLSVIDARVVELQRDIALAIDAVIGSPAKRAE